ncbi:GTP 3',8-cyclase MoaA [Phosphitispora sp. TUW77]|uniref:GTP 3',8-cyclase MoaA n=1 Tax=Phosphitispora sp. TUW77 TaxID=3152361 RepID=UPI003AB7A501
MDDVFQRNINYLRISVTDRCNLRCVYCMPEEGVNLIEHKEILSHEEIIKVIKSAVMVGIRKIRFTGGEPLLRKGITSLIAGVNEIPEIDDIALTTNGILLPKMVLELKEAGLKRINISLDTLVPEKFYRITRGGSLAKVWLGIESALDAGFEPVKINTVVIRGFNDDEVYDFAELAAKMPLNVRFIELMPIGVSDLMDWTGFVATAELLERLLARYNLVPEKVAGNGPAKSYRIPDAPGTIGFISPISNHFCALCNRLRLTSEGQLRPCLQSPLEIDLKTPLRSGATPEELAEVIRFAINSKPEKHNMEQTGWKGNRRIMTQIGG